MSFATVAKQAAFHCSIAKCYFLKHLYNSDRFVWSNHSFLESDNKWFHTFAWKFNLETNRKKQHKMLMAFLLNLKLRHLSVPGARPLYMLLLQLTECSIIARDRNFTQISQGNNCILINKLHYLSLLYFPLLLFHSFIVFLIWFSWPLANLSVGRVTKNIICFYAMGTKV